MDVTGQRKALPLAVWAWGCAGAACSGAAERVVRSVLRSRRRRQAEWASAQHQGPQRLAGYIAGPTRFDTRPDAPGCRRIEHG